MSILVLNHPPQSLHDKAGREIIFPARTLADLALLAENDQGKIIQRNAMLLDLAKEDEQRNTLASHWQILLEHYPSQDFIRYQLAHLRMLQGKFAAAESLLAAGFQLNPDSPMLNAAQAFIDVYQLRYQTSWKKFGQFWLTGYDTGHPIDKRLAAGLPLLMAAPDAQGRDAGKTLLVVLSGGLGDLFQVMRFIPLYLARGVKITIAMLEHYRTAVAGFINQLYPDVTLIRSEDCLTAKADFMMASWMLPMIADFTVKNVPPPDRLSLDALLLRRWQNWLNDKLPLSPTRPRIGISIGGSPSNPNDHLRSFSLKEIHQALADMADLVLLTYPLNPTDQAYLAQNSAIAYPFAESGITVLDLAAVVELCDVVIGADSFPLHLAGNQYKAAWTLLYDPSEFRWGAKNQTGVSGTSAKPNSAELPYSWYPTMRLFRQNGRNSDGKGDWQNVFTDVKQALSDHVLFRPKTVFAFNEYANFINKYLTSGHYTSALALLYDQISLIEQAEAKQNPSRNHPKTPADNDFCYAKSWLFLQLAIVGGASQRKDLSRLWLAKVQHLGILRHSAALWEVEVLLEQDKNDEALMVILDLADVPIHPRDMPNQAQAKRLFQSLMTSPDFYTDKILLQLLQSCLAHWLGPSKAA